MCSNHASTNRAAAARAEDAAEAISPDVTEEEGADEARADECPVVGVVVAVEDHRHRKEVVDTPQEVIRAKVPPATLTRQGRDGMEGEDGAKADAVVFRFVWVRERGAGRRKSR